MTADRRAALVEKVAETWDRKALERELAEAKEHLTRIRAEVLQEAAKVAEYRCGSPEWSNDTNSGYECAAKEIAAAIRAL